MGHNCTKEKKSDCWIYIWVILNLSPDLRYEKKYIIPGGFIPGPNNPKDIDSFIFPGLYHVCALQNEGLKIWKASLGQVVDANLYKVAACADGAGLNELNGLAGHKGAHGCRKICGTKGRHKPGETCYYAAHFKPLNYNVDGCNHANASLEQISTSIEPIHGKYEENLKYLLASPNVTQYKARRLQTGIVKPSIFSGMSSSCRLKVPDCFPIDLMHLVALNIPDLMVSLFRGTMPCDRNDSK